MFPLTSRERWGQKMEPGPPSTYHPVGKTDVSKRDSDNTEQLATSYQAFNKCFMYRIAFNCCKIIGRRVLSLSPFYR